MPAEGCPGSPSQRETLCWAEEIRCYPVNSGDHEACFEGWKIIREEQLTWWHGGPARRHTCNQQSRCLWVTAQA